MLLEGIRILDLTRLAPGPYCTMNLGDMGADVLKVEDTGAGDYMRTMGLKNKEETHAFLMLNRNKKSLSLNLKDPRGHEIFTKLIMDYDVIIEQFRPGVMEKLGLGYEYIRSLKPDIIYCSLSGYGQEGPMTMAVSHDVNYLALSGVLDSIRRPGEAPVIPGVYVGDMVSGLWASLSILAAIVRRDRSGCGQYIDVSIYEGLVSLLNMYANRFFHFGKDPGPIFRPASYNIYETADKRYVSIAAAEPKFWKALCVTLGKPEFISRLHDDQAGQDEMVEVFRSIFIQKTQNEWTEIFQNVDAMYSPVLNIEEAFEHEQFRARKMDWRIEHPVEGTVRSIGFPVKFNNDPAQVRLPPPLYGEHTREILRDLGYTDSEVSILNAEGVIKL